MLIEVPRRSFRPSPPSTIRRRLGIGRSIQRIHGAARHAARYNRNPSPLGSRIGGTTQSLLLPLMSSIVCDFSGSRAFPSNRHSTLSLAFAAATVCHCIFPGSSSPPRLRGITWSTRNRGTRRKSCRLTGTDADAGIRASRSRCGRSGRDYPARTMSTSALCAVPIASRCACCVGLSSGWSEGIYGREYQQRGRERQRGAEREQIGSCGMPQRIIVSKHTLLRPAVVICPVNANPQGASGTIER
jgi:hypothetical protein